MKIVITGGCGFIGSHIVSAYLEDGHEVIVIDDLSTGKKENISEAVKVYQVSVTSPEIEDILQVESPDVLNHHAAQIDVRKSVDDPMMDATININGSLNLFEASRKAGIKKIVFASSGGAIYGEQEYFPADESHPMRPKSPYGIAKLAVEQYLAYYDDVHDIPSVCLRYANVYGPRQNPDGEAGVIAIFIDKMMRGEAPVIYGDGRQTRDYVYVGDVVKANLKAIHSEVAGCFNVSTGVEIHVNAIAQHLIDAIGSTLKAKYEEGRKGEQLRSCINPGKLQDGEITSVQTGLKKTVDWFIANHK